jgi:hypothetical protein
MKPIRNTTEFLYDENGNEKAVVLDIRTYRNLLREAEMQSDLAEYHRAKAENQADIDAGNTITIQEYMEKRFGKKQKKRK